MVQHHSCDAPKLLIPRYAGANANYRDEVKFIANSAQPDSGAKQMPMPLHQFQPLFPAIIHAQDGMGSAFQQQARRIVMGASGHVICACRREW